MNAEVDYQLNDLDKLSGEAVELDRADPGVIDAPMQKKPEMDTGAVCDALVGLAFGLLADRRGPHWALSKTETDQLGSAVGAVLDKYLPDINTGTEIVLVVSLLVIVGPRVAADKAYAEAAAELKKRGNDTELMSSGDIPQAEFTEQEHVVSGEKRGRKKSIPEARSG